MRSKVLLLAFSILPALLAFQNCAKVQTAATQSDLGQNNSDVSAQGGSAVSNIKVPTFDVQSISVQKQVDNPEGDVTQAPAYTLTLQGEQFHYAVVKNGLTTNEGDLSVENSALILDLLSPYKMIPRLNECAPLGQAGYASIRVKDGTLVTLGERVNDCDSYLDLSAKNKTRLFSLLESL